MKDLWFDYIVANKHHWCDGFTLTRLAKVREAVLTDKNIMWDLLDRHSGDKYSPEQMQAEDKANFNHCIGNFSCSIAQKMREVGITKIK